MAVKLILAPEVEQDVAEAFAWYESQKPGLGEEFLGCVDALVQSILRMPDMYAIIYDTFRRSLVRRFPYSVFYEYLDDTVIIYGIFHTSRNPEKWRLRLR